MTDAQALSTELAYQLGYERGMQGMADLIDLADDAIERLFVVLCNSEPLKLDDPYDQMAYDEQIVWAGQARKRWRSFADTWKETSKSEA